MLIPGLSAGALADVYKRQHQHGAAPDHLIGPAGRITFSLFGLCHPGTSFFSARMLMPTNFVYLSRKWGARSSLLPPRRIIPCQYSAVLTENIPPLSRRHGSKRPERGQKRCLLPFDRQPRCLRRRYPGNRLSLIHISSLITCRTGVASCW